MKFKEPREKLFPWIKDFTDPQDELRYETNIKDMDYSTWFWFHPSAYKVITLGTPIMFGVLDLMLLTWGWYGKHNYIIGTSLFLLVVIIFIFFKIKSQYIKNSTFFDLNYREYK
jgi:hypothetical protein